MTARVFRALAGVLLLAVALPARAADVAPEATRTGFAHDADTGVLLYTEEHVEVRDGGRLLREQVTYRDPAGNLIATKELDYTPSLFLPSFLLTNHHTGHVEGGRHGAGGYLVTFQERAQSARRERQLDVPELAAGDAGFDQVILSHWEELRRGERLVRHFLVPGMLRFVKFRIHLSGGEIVVEPDSAALRWLSRPLRLVYEEAADGTPVLRRFQGVSNIRDAGGDNHVVRIEFPADHGAAVARR